MLRTTADATEDKVKSCTQQINGVIVQLEIYEGHILSDKMTDTMQKYKRDKENYDRNDKLKLKNKDRINQMEDNIIFEVANEFSVVSESNHDDRNGSCAVSGYDNIDSFANSRRPSALNLLATIPVMEESKEYEDQDDSRRSL